MSDEELINVLKIAADQRKSDLPLTMLLQIAAERIQELSTKD